MGDPHAEYTTRLAARRDTVARLVRREERISRLRLGCIIAAGVLGWFGFRYGMPSPAWALVPLAGFAVLVARHWDATAARQRAERAVVFYRRGLGRLEGTVAGRDGRALPPSGASLRRRSRSLRTRLAVRAPVHRTHGSRRGHAGRLAPRARAARRDPRPPGGGGRAAPAPRPARGPGAARRRRSRRGASRCVARVGRGARLPARAVGTLHRPCARGGRRRRCRAVGARPLAAPGGRRDAGSTRRARAASPRPARRARGGAARTRPPDAGGAPRTRRAGALRRAAPGRPARRARHRGPAAFTAGGPAAAPHRSARRTPQPALRTRRLAAAVDDAARALDRGVA